MAKVVIRKPHYLDGVFYKASPEFPAVLEVQPHWDHKANPDMEPIGDDQTPEPEKPGKHFDTKPKEHVQSSVQVQSEPQKSKRPSDKQPI